jgi:hypothetical protein
MLYYIKGENKMKQIRKNVFETNSSSTHSLTITDNYKDIASSQFKFKMSYENTVSMEFGEFGWGYSEHTDAKTKFEYLCTMWWSTEAKRNFVSLKDLKQQEGFLIIQEFVREVTQNPNICLKIPTIKLNDYGGNCFEIDIDGYIDHQSLDDYTSLKSFLDAYGITAKDFVLNPNIKLIIDNDNH